MRRGVKKVNYHLLEMENSLADDIREEEAVGRLDELRSGRAPAPVPVPFSIWFPTQCLVLLLEPRLNPDRTLQGSFLGWRFQQDFLYTHSNSTSLVKGGIVPSLHHQLVLSTICNVASSSTWSVGNDSSVWEGREATTSFQEVVTDPGRETTTSFQEVVTDPGMQFG